jgi:hypothetical protein
LCDWSALQLSGLGDAERVYIQPASAIGGSAPRGISSVMAQRIVRQAAVALKDLHSMSGHMHLDLKVNNLLVSGRDTTIVVGWVQSTRRERMNLLKSC